MHALGSFLDRQIKARGWTAAEFARRSGLSRQNVYQLLDPDRQHLGRLLEERTAQRLATALDLPLEAIWLKCLESLGVPAGNLAITEKAGAEPVAAELPNEVLAEQVRSRLLGMGGASGAELERLRLMHLRLKALVDSLPTGTQTVSTSQVREVLTGVEE